MEQTRAGSLVKDFFSDKGDIILPLIISVVAHGFLIYLVFSGGAQLRGQNARLYAGKKLAMAEDFIVGQSNVLLARLSERLSSVRSSPQEVDAMDWTVDTTPVKIASAAQRAGLNLTETRLAKAEENGQGERYHVMMKIYTTADRVFDDILFASYLVGDGTLHSKFKTEKLIISLKDKGAPGVTEFSTYTRETRRLYLNRISPQEFLLDAIVQEGKDW